MMQDRVKGARITSLQEFADADFIWWRGHVFHRGSTHSWTLRNILTGIDRGDYFHAVWEGEENGRSS